MYVCMYAYVRIDYEPAAVTVTGLASGTPPVSSGTGMADLQLQVETDIRLPERRYPVKYNISGS